MYSIVEGDIDFTKHII